MAWPAYLSLDRAELHRRVADGLAMREAARRAGLGRIDERQPHPRLRRRLLLLS